MSFFRQKLLAGFAALCVAVSALSGAVSITESAVTNIGTTTFTVVWTTSEVSTPGLDVFTDAAGLNNITATLGLDYYPIAEGDPTVVNSTLARTGRRSLELLAINRRVVSVRVTGLSPGVTYYVRPRTFDGTGVDNGASVVPLKSATTAQFTSMVGDARVLQIRIPTFAAEGMILLVQGPAGTTPLSAIVGDSAAADIALFSTADLLDTTTGTTALFTSPQQFVIKAIGAGAPASTFAQTINFSAAFNVAKSEPIEAAIVSPAPFITTQPASTTVVAGGTATFNVAATGTPAPVFKWQRKPAGGSTWTDLAAGPAYTGVTSVTLSVVDATLAMNGDQFRAIAANGVPADAISDVATLTVSASAVAPAITTQPEPAAAVAGMNATFTVAASGTPAPTYQWQRKAAGSVSWSDLTAGGAYSGVTGTTLTISNATLAMTGDEFRAIATNGVQPAATSNAVALTVSSTPIAPAITAQPQSKSVAAGTSATFTVAASGTPTPTYTWQIKLAGGSTWLDIGTTAGYSGANKSAMTVTSVTAAMNGDQYRVLAANGTAPDALSDAATLTVIAPPTISGQPQPVSVAGGTAATFSVTATGTGALSYLWQRLPAGTLVWQDLANDATYAGTTTASLQVKSVLSAMSGDQFRVVVTDTVGSATSGLALLTVTRGAATVVLSELRQVYDGSPRAVVATTTPAGLAVTVTYNGTATAPVAPGVYAVSAQVEDPNYSGSATGELVVGSTVLVRRAPAIAGGVDGSVHVLTPEAISLTGWISGDLLVRGTPSLVNNGSTTLGGIRDGTGAIDPADYSVTFESTAALRYLVRRTDEVTMPTVVAPPVPTGTRNVSLTAAGQTAGDFATVRNLSVNGTVGLVAVPPGTYGSLTANGSAGFVFGVAGATEPAVYNLQSLSINPLAATARLVVVGPVIINVASIAVIFGNTGAPEHPEWLTLSLANGNMSLNSTAVLSGYVIAPNSAVTLSGRSTIKGGVIADRLTVSATAAVKQNQP